MNQLSLPTLTQEEHRLIQEFEKPRPREFWVVAIGLTVAAVLFGLAIGAWFMDRQEHRRPPCSEWGWTPDVGKECIRWGWRRK